MRAGREHCLWDGQQCNAQAGVKTHIQEQTSWRGKTLYLVFTSLELLSFLQHPAARSIWWRHHPRVWEQQSRWGGSTTLYPCDLQLGHPPTVTQSPSLHAWAAWPMAPTNSQWFVSVKDLRPSATVSQERVWNIPSKQMGQLRLRLSLVVPSPVPTNEADPYFHEVPPAPPALSWRSTFPTTNIVN